MAAGTPKRAALAERLAQGRAVLGDGGMGTQLMARGMKLGDCPELWNVEHASDVRAVHDAYVAAGACVLETNSFGGNAYRLRLHALDSPERIAALNRAAAALARASADACTTRQVYVAGSLGPTGQLLAPLGPLSEVDARAAYATQAAALRDGGVDFFLVETMSALEEVRAAVLGVRDACGETVQIAVTMSFGRRGRTIMGVRPADGLRFAVKELGVRIVGANCGSGPQETLCVMEEMAAARAVLEKELGTRVFLVAQANAGTPTTDAATGETSYAEGTPDVMAAFAERFAALGVEYIGACCGSTPAHIAAMDAALQRMPPK
eukprot:TRINITY_DN1421_c2_g1_i1.p1 TRINITY_DN1421_c2_g1~~TRINITY_DN1421_c2_g1_i1.p1  ORF type:complete len:322 (+),score=94.24 TRINITY_DN1421_c2_g1_i1:452-1417(+)